MYAPKVIAVIDKQFELFSQNKGMKLNRPLTITHFFHELEKATGRQYVVEGANANIPASGRFVTNLDDLQGYLFEEGIFLNIEKGAKQTIVRVSLGTK